MRRFFKNNGLSLVMLALFLLFLAAQLAYARGPGWQSVDLPYDGGGLAMAVVVPDAGRLDEIVDGFDVAFIRAMLIGLQPTGVALRLPRWTFRTQVLLNEVLAGLGMPTSFTPDADFSGMTACTPDRRPALPVRAARPRDGDTAVHRTGERPVRCSVTARRTTEPQKNNAATPNNHQFSA